MIPDYTHLYGREFIWGEQDCLGLVRAFYKDVLDIEMPNFARPEDFWQHNLNLFDQNYRAAGFSPINVHPEEWQFGDVLVCAIDSQFGNHCAVLLENGKFLHHLYGGLSRDTPYRGLLRNTTIAMYRHRDITAKLPDMTLTGSLRDHLSPKMQERYDALVEAGSQAA